MYLLELMYKMFRVTGMTTASELISMSLKKANLIEDPHCFSINLLHNTTKGKKYFSRLLDVYQITVCQ